MLDDQSSPKGHVLFVDDDADVLKAARLLIERHGLRLSAARSPAETWSVLETEPVDVILLDLNFTRGATSGEEGFTHLRELLAQDPQAVVVVVTAHSGVNVAVAAMRAGACDFVMKPWSNERLLTTLRTALELRRKRLQTAALAAENAVLNDDAWGPSAPLLGDSPAITRVRELIRRAAPTDAPVLIYGASGTGKSLIARNIHLQSSRSGGAFLSVDLGALDPEEAERVLFGAGRSEASPGAFVEARGGTLCLDEIGSLAASIQARLLGVLETGKVQRAGAVRPLAVDVRVVSTTRRRREELHGRGGLRGDLLYRLNTVEIFAPSLVERGDDAVVMARHFLRVYARRYGRDPKPLAPEVEQALLQGGWTGDARALRQAAERCVIFSDGARYELADFPLRGGLEAETSAPDRSELNLVRSEKALISAALQRNSFNVSHAARELGLSRAALYRRMAKHGL